MTHIWFWKSVLGDRKGQPCRVICAGKMNSVLVEFEDGFRVVTSRYAVRKIAQNMRKDYTKLAFCARG